MHGRPEAGVRRNKSPVSFQAFRGFEELRKAFFVFQNNLWEVLLRYPKQSLCWTT